MFNSKYLCVVAVASSLAALFGTAASLHYRTMAQSPTEIQVPKFELDASWPKPLSNFWTVGEIGAPVSTIRITFSF